jgi:hypothetical protein
MEGTNPNLCRQRVRAADVISKCTGIMIQYTTVITNL